MGTQLNDSVYNYLKFFNSFINVFTIVKRRVLVTYVKLTSGHEPEHSKQPQQQSVNLSLK